MVLKTFEFTEKIEIYTGMEVSDVPVSTAMDHFLNLNPRGTEGFLRYDYGRRY